MHEFGWSADDHDRLAAGSLVGHLLECGRRRPAASSPTGRTCPTGTTSATRSPNAAPTARSPSPSRAGTGGLVTPATVAEQVLYEIGDPAAYLLPDVTADFSNVRLVQDGPDRVAVSGARGRPPTDRYKVSATYQDGYRATAMVSIVGVDAARKAERTGGRAAAARVDAVRAAGHRAVLRDADRSRSAPKPRMPARRGHARPARSCCGCRSSTATRRR